MIQFIELGTSRAKILKLPHISSGGVSEDIKSNQEKNPFHMPCDVEIFSMREDDKKAKLEVVITLIGIHAVCLN